MLKPSGANTWRGTTPSLVSLALSLRLQGENKTNKSHLTLTRVSIHVTFLQLWKKCLFDTFTGCPRALFWSPHFLMFTITHPWDETYIVCICDNILQKISIWEHLCHPIEELNKTQKERMVNIPLFLTKYLYICITGLHLANGTFRTYVLTRENKLKTMMCL